MTQAIKTSLRNYDASIHNLENQISQLANLVSGKQQGSLLDNTELNLQDHVKIGTLKGGKEIKG